MVLSPAPVSSPAPRCIFRPVLALAEGQIHRLYAEPRLARSEGGELIDEEFLKQGSDSRSANTKQLAASHAFVVRQAGRKLAELEADGNAAAKVIVPLSGVALMHRDVAGRFTEECRAIPRAAYSRLIFEITGLTDESKMSYLDDLAIILHAFCDQYIARITPTLPDPKIFSTCNYAALTLHLMDKPWPIAALRPQLTRMVERARNARLETILYGVGTDEILEMAREIGFDFAGGAAVERRPDSRA